MWLHTLYVTIFRDGGTIKGPPTCVCGGGGGGGGVEDSMGP